MTFTEMSDIVLAAPKVEWGFVTRTERLQKSKSHRMPGGADAWVWKQSRSGDYRVVLATDSALAEVEHAELGQAIRQAFEKLQLPVPETLKLRRIEAA